MKMARLAESSVVVALRDTQWEIAQAHGCKPDLFVSLSGNTDKKLGDVKFSRDEKFYLIEAKSTSSEIWEEWQRGSSTPRKHAHRKVREIIEGLPGKSSPDYLNLFNISLAAHHFLYYSFATGEHELAMEPYALATQIRGGFEEIEGAEYGVTRTDQQKLRLLRGLRASKKFELFDCILRKKISRFLIQQLYQKTVEIHEASPLNTIISLGVPLKQFQIYVDFLCDGKTEEIETLIKTTSGKLIAFSGETNSLHQLVASFQEIEPNPDAKLKSELK
ncbi:hypothetical protein VDG64_13355 [Xanthomonas campestris pv. raphani]|uniref:hypothetical protein n=2 Tax=Xanthomonas campestris TaxID=339 RepID=UPI002B23D37D|nr:hypothetical protein [Xanthomonas campestris]MEA9755913.1 hypothetical protein [Xanthomonas campestris pv. raphani]MEA9957762.1 hypothetical protein [Xanthomonas campestris pv. raphani]